MCKPSVYYKRKNNKPLIMYEMDLWPESLLAGGITNKSFIFKHYKKVSAKIYSQCDKILVTTKEHIPYIKELIGRTPLPAPTFHLNPEIKDFYDFTRNDVNVENYEVAGDQFKDIPIAI